jgi:hypothetical protein
MAVIYWEAKLYSYPENSFPEVFANLTIALPSAAWQGYSEIGISHFYKRFIWTTILS